MTFTLCRAYYPSVPLPTCQASLKERFDWEGRPGPQWQVLEGGRPCTDCGVLVEGTALYFGGADARQAVTVDMDLRGAKLVPPALIPHHTDSQNYKINIRKSHANTHQLNVRCKKRLI